MKVYLIGVGMGNPATLTAEAARAIGACTLLIGAARMLEPYRAEKNCVALVRSSEIAARIKEEQEGPVGVLLSGDPGFYSGATALRELLEGMEVVTLPGLSSLSYFCARLNTTWQDVYPMSAHGRSHNAVGEIQRRSKTFLLTGGQTRAQDICAQLTERGLGAVEIAVGERLSYPDERIVTGTAEELAGETFDDLAVVLAVNPRPVQRAWAAPSLPDGAFLRGEAPMTKEEVRALAICRLRIAEDHVVWDVGAGTGSVSVECALAAPAGRVYAVERKEEALALLRANRERFDVPNLEIVPGTAPGALAELPAPDRVFLGGTAGNLEEILAVIFEKNPACRVVLTAVTLETLAQASAAFAALRLEGVEMTQLAVTNTRTVGSYHMFSAQNPVWMLSGEGKG